MGRLESAAAVNLLTKVEPTVRQGLKDAVRRGPVRIHFLSLSSLSSRLKNMVMPLRLHSQPKYILHEGLAAGVFNSDYNGASAQMQPWERHLLNSEPILDLLLNRMRKDWESASPKMRKPWNQAQLDARLK